MVTYGNLRYLRYLRYVITHLYLLFFRTLFNSDAEGVKYLLYVPSWALIAQLMSFSLQAIVSTYKYFDTG